MQILENMILIFLGIQGMEKRVRTTTTASVEQQQQMDSVT